jgi:hypothetical protein
MSGINAPHKTWEGASKGAPIMPGCNVGAKRLNRIQGNIVRRVTTGNRCYAAARKPAAVEAI